MDAVIQRPREQHSVREQRGGFHLLRALLLAQTQALIPDGSAPSGTLYAAMEWNDCWKQTFDLIMPAANLIDKR